MTRTITICSHRRPEYLEQVLESLAVALEYCPEYKPDRVLIGIDPEPYYGMHDRVVKIAAKSGFESFVWPEHLGVSEHPRRLLQWIFEKSEFNLHMEDDTVLSPDALRLCMWFLRYPRPAILSLHSAIDSNDPALVIKRADFGVWGWACRAYMWIDHIAPTWNHKREGKLGWDWSLSHTIYQRKLTVLSPVLSRVRNIGRELGCHQTPEGFDIEMEGATWADAKQAIDINKFLLDPAEPTRCTNWPYGE